MSSYKTEKVISEGKDGPVLLIRNRKGKRLVMKKYRYDAHSKWGMKPEIFTEMMLLGEVKGLPNLLQLEDIEFRRGEVQFIFEYLEGGTLENLIKKKLDVGSVVNVMRQILSGLVELHRRGVIHNDLKPLNIMYRSNDGKGRGEGSSEGGYEVKIIDFGLCYLVNYPYHRAHKIRGTHHYTPPEYRDHRAIGRISVNSDMYSLGIIFYYLVMPSMFNEYDDNPDHHQIFDPHNIDWESIEKKIGKDGRNLLEMMMDFDPDRRISSKDALAHPFLSGSKGHQKSHHRPKKHKKRKGGGMRNRVSMIGGSDRRYEEPRLMTREEWSRPKNGDYFLPDVVELSLESKWRLGGHKHNIPNFVWEYFYEQFNSLELKFESLNYAMVLMHHYLSLVEDKIYQWEALVFACLLISVKVNEYSFHFNAKSFEYNDYHSILEMETDVVKLLFKAGYGLPIPVLMGKEVVLYYYYLQIIYGSKQKIMGALYNHYFIMNLISSLVYTDRDLCQEDKFEVVKALLSLGFPALEIHKGVRASEGLKSQLVHLFKQRVHHVNWLNSDVLKHFLKPTE